MMDMGQKVGVVKDTAGVDYHVFHKDIAPESIFLAFKIPQRDGRTTVHSIDVQEDITKESLAHKTMEAIEDMHNYRIKNNLSI